MDKQRKAKNAEQRLRVYQEAMPDLLLRHADHPELVRNAVEWWLEHGTGRTAPPPEFAYLVSLLMTYQTWRSSVSGLVRESRASYRIGPKPATEFQRFLLEREQYIPEFPAESGPHLDYAIRSLLGKSGLWKDVTGLVQMASFSDVPTLISGETGTGKDEVARIIHECGSRASCPFLQIPSPYLSHEHYREQLQGLAAEQAAPRDGLLSLDDLLRPFGTVYFSDIDQLPQPLQPMFASRIRQRYSQLSQDKNGLNLPRYIASTTEDLDQLTRRRQFRHDLYLEIAILQIDLPPLRHRREDLPELIAHLLFQLGKRYGLEAPKLHPDALRKVEQHLWPGNLAELRKVLDRALLTSRREIRAKDLHFERGSWLPEGARNQGEVLAAVSRLERGGFKAGSVMPETLVSYFFHKGRSRFRTSELAQTLDVAQSTARSYLDGLRKLGFVVKHGDRKSATWSVNIEKLKGGREEWEKSVG